MQKTGTRRKTTASMSTADTSEPRREAPINVPSLLPGLSAVADAYDGFIVDLWGTVHDGYEPLPGAVECLRSLMDAGKKILILSNAPRRAHSVVRKMAEVGIPETLCHDVFSSGEAAHLALARRDDAFHRGLGDTCFLLGPPDDDSVLEDVPVKRTDRIEEADFILGIGPFERPDKVEQYDGLLVKAHKRDVPFVCANPDLVVLRGEAREICAGAIAARYEEIGGRVFYHGKPHPAIYEASLHRLGLDDPARIAAVGDSLHTDVAGALAAGMGAYFITSGIYADELGVQSFDEPSAAALRDLYSRHGATPHAALTAFRW